MAELTDLLDRCKGTRTHAVWAEHLGVTQATVSWWLAGKFVPDRENIRRLIQAHPEHRGELMRVLLGVEPVASEVGS